MLLKCGGGTVVKNPPANAGDTGDMGSIPGSERSLGERNGKPLQYSCLGNPIDRGAWAWRAIVHGVAKSQTQLSDWAHTRKVYDIVIHNFVKQCNLNGGSVVKNPPATQEIYVWSLGWEDLLEEKTTTHSNILAWRIPQSGLTGYSTWVCKELDYKQSWAPKNWCF